MSGENLCAEIFGPKVDKIGHFSIFFGFSNLIVELFVVEETFCRQKYVANRAAQSDMVPIQPTLSVKEGELGVI